MNTTKAAVALGAGYLLGRWHKGRWALALAGMAAGKRVGTNPRALLGQLMESSPQLRELADGVRGELADAGKKAAVAAAGNRLEDLTERLRDRTESLRDGAGEGHRGEESDEDEQDEPDEQDGGQKRGRSQTSRKTSGSNAASRSGGSRKRTSDSDGSASSSRPASRTAKKKTTASSSSGRRTTGASARRSTSKSASGKQE